MSSCAVVAAVIVGTALVAVGARTAPVCSSFSDRPPLLPLVGLGLAVLGVVGGLR